MAGRRRNSSSTENPSASSSKRTNVPRSTALKPCDTRALVPPGRDGFHVDVERILEDAGLTPLVLTRAEAACAEETPGIELTTFTELFGGTRNSEWPQCSKVPGYENFVCTAPVSQPFMPLGPGKPGILLRVPTIIKTPRSDHDRSTLHVLSKTHSGGTLHYRGKYAIIPLPQIQFTWTNFPPKVRYE